MCSLTGNSGRTQCVHGLLLGSGNSARRKWAQLPLRKLRFWWQMRATNQINNIQNLSDRDSAWGRMKQARGGEFGASLQCEINLDCPPRDGIKYRTALKMLFGEGA